MDQYQLQARSEAERLDAEAEVMAAAVRRNIQRARELHPLRRPVLRALFFAGMSARYAATYPRKVLLVVGCTIFAGTAAWIASFPINVSV